MESLFDNRSRYTKDAEALMVRANTTLMPLFEEYVEKGFSPTDISHIIKSTVTDIELETILGF
jgi:hypothetical protein